MLLQKTYECKQMINDDYCMNDFKVMIAKSSSVCKQDRKLSHFKLVFSIPQYLELLRAERICKLLRGKIVPLTAASTLLESCEVWNECQIDFLCPCLKCGMFLELHSAKGDRPVYQRYFFCFFRVSTGDSSYRSVIASVTTACTIIPYCTYCI